MDTRFWCLFDRVFNKNLHNDSRNILKNNIWIWSKVSGCLKKILAWFCRFYISHGCLKLLSSWCKSFLAINFKNRSQRINSNGYFIAALLSQSTLPCHATAPLSLCWLLFPKRYKRNECIKIEFSTSSLLGESPFGAT